MASLEQKVQWIQRSDKTMDPRDFYKTYYANLTHDELKQADPILFHVLRLRKLIAIVPAKKSVAQKQKEHKPKKPRPILPLRPWGNDPVSYYKEHYPSVTRKVLERTNPRLYKRLWRDDLLDIVPKETKEAIQQKLRTSQIRNSRFGEDPLAYYQAHYAGLSRGALKREDQELYQRLRAGQLLQHVPRTTTDFGEDPLAYYQEHCLGCTRSELKEKHKGLYERLRKDKTLENVPLTRSAPTSTQTFPATPTRDQ